MDLFNSKVLTNLELKIAGWIAITGAILTIPAIAFVIYQLITSPETAGEFSFFGETLNLIGTALYIFVFYTFKKLLNVRHKFHDADFAILGYIYLNVALFVTTLASYTLDWANLLLFVIFVPTGIIMILQGIKLLKLKNDLFGLKKTYIYQTIAAGFLLASIVLFLLSLIPYIIALFILGIILLRSSEN